jgi:hypothetical protein
MLKPSLCLAIAELIFSFGLRAQPTLVSVSPSSGSGQNQEFTVTVTDPLGASTITYIDLLINSSLDGQNACWLYFDNAGKQLYLAGDSEWGGSNTHCSASLVSATDSGNKATLTVNLTFNSNWAGVKGIWLAAGDSAGNNSNYREMATFDVGSIVAPSVSMSPASGSGSGGTFTFTATGHGGASNATGEDVLINTSLNGTGACWMYFNGQLWLANDSGTNWTSAGEGQSLQNSQCTVSSLQDLSSGNVEGFRITIAFAAGFAGKKNIYSYAANQVGANTGYQLVGNWTVGASSGSHQATLNWNASMTPSLTYNVYRGTVSGGPYSKINSSAVSALSYTDTSVAAGQVYYYVVTAVNSSNVESGYSNQAMAAIPAN